MLPAYAELHCLSNFSFLRGASHPEELAERAQALGYAALAITDECSVSGAVRAHLAAKEAGLPLVIGSEFTLGDEVKLVLLATDRASYGNLTQLITRGRRQAKKGAYALSRDDVADVRRRGCSRCGCRRTMHRRAGARPTMPQALRDRTLARRDVPATGPGSPSSSSPAPATARGSPVARSSSQASGLPQVAAGDVHMHARARRALQDTVTAIRLKKPLADCGHALFSNGERHLRSRARLATIYPPALLAETVAIARALHVFAGRAALRVSRGDRAAGRDAGVASAQADRGRARAALSGRSFPPTSAS